MKFSLNALFWKATPHKAQPYPCNIPALFKANVSLPPSRIYLQPSPNIFLLGSLESQHEYKIFLFYTIFLYQLNLMFYQPES
jgi:hypothetical protein